LIGIGEVRETELTPVELAEVAEVRVDLARRRSQEFGFEVEAVQYGCKTFVLSQKANRYLAENDSCPQPRQGETGFGDLNQRYGVNVEMRGTSCRLARVSEITTTTSSAEALRRAC
jgi:hypothetical protein